jgi:hypothetical protein
VRASLVAFAAIGAALSAGCSRDDVWSTTPGPLVAQGLTGAAALVDSTANRVLLIPVRGDLTIDPRSVPIGHGYASSGVTADGGKLLVLSHGDVPRTMTTDQAPSLTVVGGSTSPGLLGAYPLSDPLSGIALDPEAEFAVIYPSAADSAFVENPNELVIVDLGQAPGAANPTELTLRSFGGLPQSFVFTPTLGLPAGPTRLLVALTDRDIGIIDLDHQAEGDITVGLSSSGQVLTPVEIAVTDSDPASGADARLAVRIDGDASIVVVDLAPVPAGTTPAPAHSFAPTPNEVLAGGVPADIAFVTTDAGLRLAALVPSQQALALIDPATGISTSVTLAAPFERMSIVTGSVDPGGGGDIALLWSGSSPDIAFVALGGAVGKPYAAVQQLALDVPISAVYDVPKPNDRLKILAATDGQTFYVLDLVARTASPILASSGGVSIGVSPDGRRAWFASDVAPDIASLDLDDLHPRNLILALPVAAAFDVERKDGGRALVAVHDGDDVGLTVLDGTAPSLETAVDYAGVLLGDLP